MDVLGKLRVKRNGKLDLRRSTHSFQCFFLPPPRSLALRLCRFDYGSLTDVSGAKRDCYPLRNYGDSCRSARSMRELRATF